MQITTLTYRRLVSHRGEYGHDALEASAAVPEGADAKAASADLMTFVQQQLGVLAETDTLTRKHDRLSGEIERLTRNRDELKAEIEAVDKVIDQFELLADMAREKGALAEARAVVDALESRIPF